MKEKMKKLEGSRVFVAYRKANGRLTTRMVKVITVVGENVRVWCEKRDAMRTFKLSGIEKLVRLGANEIY